MACLVVLAALVPGVARADEEAEALYRDGRRAAQAKDWPTACAKLRASADREAAPGTLLNLGDCEEHRGHLRDARASFEAAARMFKPGDERGAYARQRLAALERRIPKLTAKLAPGSPADTHIELDGAQLASKEPVFLEPGEHVLIARAPGRSNVESRITLAEGESRTVVLTAGARVALIEPAPVAAAPFMATPPATHEGSGVRTAGWIVLGLGGAGLATGAVAGLMTMNAKSAADDNCPPVGCNRVGQDAQEAGKMWSAVSTTAFIAGGVAAATGLGLLVFGPSAKSQVGVGPGTVRFGGTF